MNIKNIKNIYFIGIGGIGMSALARYFNLMKKNIAGYDLTPTQLTDTLQKEGIDIHFEDDVSKIAETFKNKAETLIVYTPAVPDSHSELSLFRKNGFTILKRSEVLGLLTKEKFSIAVAGTHGKTTTSAMIAHILKQSGADCSAFLGGIATNYQSNFLWSDNSDYVVVEADEYDRSFLQLHPDFAVVTSVEPDHLDIYKNEEELQKAFYQFTAQIKPEGSLILRQAIKLRVSVERFKYIYNYDIKEGSIFYSDNIRIENGKYMFDFVEPIDKKIENIRLQMPGLHNVENATAAATVASLLKIGKKEIKAALESFKGIKRRFEYQINRENLVFIDDYAHHPKEIKACFEAARELYPQKTITGIFQPHLYSRTRDFADEFAQSLSLFDKLILLDIYPAREKPIKGINAELIFNKVKLNDKTIVKNDELIEYLKKNETPEVMLTLGAGNIGKKIEAIKNVLLNKIKQ